MVNDFDIFNILIQVICNGISDYNISPELLQMIRSVNICIKEILNKNFIIWRFTPQSLAELKIAVLEYTYHKRNGIRRYGEISRWDISKINSLFFLFSSFADDDIEMISRYTSMVDFCSVLSDNYNYNRYYKRRSLDQNLYFIDCLHRGDTLRTKILGMSKVDIDLDYLRNPGVFHDIDIDSLEVTDIINIYPAIPYWMIPIKNFENIDFNISKWDTSHVKNWMGTFFQFNFNNCLKLKEGLKYLNLDEAIKMNYMFNGAEGLWDVNFSKWLFPKCRTMSYMFEDTDIIYMKDFNDWKIEEVGQVHGLFYGCELLLLCKLPSKWTDVHSENDIVMELYE